MLAIQLAIIKNQIDYKTVKVIWNDLTITFDKLAYPINNWTYYESVSSQIAREIMKLRQEMES